MDLSSYIDFNALSGDAKKELKTFYDYLLLKYRTGKNKRKRNSKKSFNAVRIDTRGFNFNREEANAR